VRRAGLILQPLPLGQPDLTQVQQRIGEVLRRGAQGCAAVLGGQLHLGHHTEVLQLVEQEPLVGRQRALVYVYAELA
jgi:hypothetical protein